MPYYSSRTRGYERSYHTDRDSRRSSSSSHDRDDDDYHRKRSRDHSNCEEFDDSHGGRRHRSTNHHHNSRSRSRSPRSKSKRTTGFDIMAPSAAVDNSTSIDGLFLLPPAPLSQQATRHARRVYVGGIPPTANEQSVATFFGNAMSAIGGNTAGPGGNAVVNVYINHEKKFAFVEMRSVEEASNAMALDGIVFYNDHEEQQQGGGGTPVKVRRPSDYNPSVAASLGSSQPNPNLNLAAVGLTQGGAGGGRRVLLDGPDRIFVGGIPYGATEEHIKELLETFGPLRGFDLVKDKETGNSKGYAFCVYEDPSVTDTACAALNEIFKIGDRTLTVRRASQPADQHELNVLMLQAQQEAMQRLLLLHAAGGHAGAQPTTTTTKVVCLTQVAITVDELNNDEEYEDTLEDMRVEGSKYGSLVTVVIPRPAMMLLNDHGQEVIPSLGGGIGRVFLEYADTESASKAFAGLNGRKYGGNHAVAVYYPENKFSQGVYDA